MSLGVKGLISTSKSGYLHLLVHLFYLFVIVGVILEVARPFRDYQKSGTYSLAEYMLTVG